MSSREATKAFTAATSIGAFVKMPSELNVMTLISGRVRAKVDRSRKTATHGWEGGKSAARQSMAIKPRLFPFSHVPYTNWAHRCEEDEKEISVSVIALIHNTQKDKCTA